MRTARSARRSARCGRAAGRSRCAPSRSSRSRARRSPADAGRSRSTLARGRAAREYDERISGSPAAIICSTATRAAGSSSPTNSSRSIWRGRSSRRRRRPARSSARCTPRCWPSRAARSPAAEIAAIADADARENWQVMIAFRDHLLAPPHARGGLSRPRARRRGKIAAPVRQSARARHPAQRARRLRRSVRAARGRAVLPAAAHDPARGLADRRRRGDHRRHRATRRSRRWSRCSALPAEAEIDVLNDDNADAYWEHSDQFDMALDLTAGRRGLAALGEVMRRWIAHLLGVEVEIEPLTEMRDATLTWYVGLDAEGTRIGDALWNGEELDEATRGARGRAVPPDASAIPRVVDGQGARRAGLSDPGDDAGQDAAHEAAEPRHRPADRAIWRRSHERAARAHSGRRRGRARARPTSPWIDFVWRPVVGAAGRAGRRAVDACSSGDGDAHDVLCRHRRRSNCYRTETAELSRQSRDRRAVAVGGAAADRARAALRRWSRSRPIPPKARPSPKPAPTWSSRCRCRRRSATID